MTERLGVWMHGLHVADLLEAGSGLAAVEHTQVAVERYAGRPLLSLRLPVRPERYTATEARAFLEGIAPEGPVRAALAARARLPVQDTLGLLRAYGRECAGAVSFMPEGETPDHARSSVEWLSDDELEQRIRRLPSEPFAADAGRGVRISLGGIQGKLVVVVDGDRYGLPVGTTPSTHILKPEQFDEGTARYPGIVEAECFGLRLAAALAADGAASFVVPPARVISVSERRTALLIERYDRGQGEGGIARIHQEDACSALGLTPEAKYEGADRRPSLALVSALLTEHVVSPIEDRSRLLQLVAFNAQLGNADLHAKNISVLIGPEGPRLAPLYDPVATFVWPGTSRELGLRIGGEYHLDDVTVESVVDEGTAWGFGAKACRSTVGSLVGAAAAAAPAVVEAARDEGWHHPVIDDVVARVIEFAATG